MASFGQQLKILKWQGPLRPCGRMEEAHRVHCFGHTHIYIAKKITNAPIQLITVWSWVVRQR